MSDSARKPRAPDREILRGREFDFICSDVNGMVAVFSSAGYGPIPVEALTRVEEEDAALNWIKTLPATGVAHNITGLGNLSYWTELSERGLYCFDWQHWDGPYRRVCTPSAPTDLQSVFDTSPLEPTPIALDCQFDTWSSVELQALGIDLVV